jgi:hypothetical protein
MSVTSPCGCTPSWKVNHEVTQRQTGLILYEVQRHLGIRVRALMDRQFGKLKGFPAEFLAAGGGIVGEPRAAGELMSANEPILVFPGGGREIAKARDELYTLLWGDRAGFARLAAEYVYPIVTAAVVGGDDVSAVSPYPFAHSAIRWHAIRAGDPFRNLAPWSWGAAVMPPASAAAQSTSATHTEGDVVQ